MAALINTIPHISMPGSSIKSPGSLLSMIKTETRSKDSSLSLENEIDRHIELLSSDEVLSDKNLSIFQSPTNQYQNLVTKLFQYNIQVNNHIDTQQANSILSHLAEEISQLPQNFMLKLQLKITLSNHPDVFNERGFFKSEDLLNQAKLNDKLYRLMFERLLANFPSVMRIWFEEDDEVEEEEKGKMSTQLAQIHKMEAAFYAIMQNRKHPKTKFDVIKLRKILIKIDPLSFSAEWFKERNLQLKKNFHVQFDI